MGTDVHRITSINSVTDPTVDTSTKKVSAGLPQEHHDQTDIQTDKQNLNKE